MDMATQRLNRTIPSLPDIYFNWLYDQVCYGREPGSGGSYLDICGMMHRTRFRVCVPMDDNRAADGVELREEFLATQEYVFRRFGHDSQGEKAIKVAAPSVFEVLVALSRKADFMVSFGEKGWFRIFLENLGLHDFTDTMITGGDVSRVNRIIAKFNNRTYRPSGAGGLFPLKRATEDQRHVELWYQMCAYMAENHMY